MGDAKDKDQAGGSNAAPTAREREATRDETLDDIDRTEDATVKPSGDTSTSPSGGGTPAPSPDGAFDGERGGRADGSEAGEPM